MIVGKTIQIKILRPFLIDKNGEPSIWNNWIELKFSWTPIRQLVCLNFVQHIVKLFFFHF